ncbi:prolyl oligopeptidase family serine peptidase [Isoptericola sp. b441]|uniref:Prolyl oligopeptidase family serine peptidase n=1 Tax=Actinotalea lenta TaxID=3064654 RepID=A0ABT9D5L0_9CELL|nr:MULTISPECIES: prolyl oligopeptidase family serine peptidase [unclassified Isoptericola]MDO8106070.1 prolyl oligopeptidase family serine peptidase [Isoptericola sp. b441]MDO8122211.1 prolyl oligopeptidase family serine peptidase [Isoptericola sp. b490]
MTLSTPFHDLDEYVALPRLSGLVLSPDGSRLVTTVSTLNQDRTTAHTALWEIFPTRSKPARRLTRSAQGETGAAFTPDGDLLFTSKRPDADAKESEKPLDTPALWVLPAGGGEARVVATRPGGVAGVKTARSSAAVVFSTRMLPSALDAKDDERLRTLRKDTKVSAILHDGYPVRYWDHDLGPDAPHLVGWHFTHADEPARAVEVASRSVEHLDVTDLTPTPGAALEEADYDLSPGGGFVVSTWRVPGAKAEARTHLVRIDLDTQDAADLARHDDADLAAPVISPDGRQVAYLAETLSTPEQAPQVQLFVLPLDEAGLPGGTPRRVAADWDRWVTGLQWLPDGSGLVVTADQGGRGPVFVVDLAGDAVHQLTDDDYTYSDLQVAPDAGVVYALRTSYLAPPHPVRIALADRDVPAGTVTVLRAPVPPPTLPGYLEEVFATGTDGTPVRGWLALPDEATAESPAPLLLWIHGGPLGSWNAWSWRWNPWLMVAQGYAVLLPDPALSTGYGQEFIQRGWGAWGAAPFTDLMAVTDTVEARPDIDATRTAAMGGSFGGYMANWVAGHTDRFRAIVTHASLWALDQFGPTTDAAFYWGREMTPEMALENSPHRFVEQIGTPMLVVHGDKDYRVPIGEGLRLWYELLSRSRLAADDQGRSPHRFLYFPDENHWVLSPQHAKVWYSTVLAFLSEHVLGEEPKRAESLG